MSQVEDRGTVGGDGARPKRVVGIGTSSVDHLCIVARHPRLDSKQPLVHYEVQPGGQVPTALAALQRWGIPTAYVGAFGDDPGGHLVRGALAREGVDIVASIVRPNTNQPVSVILIDEVTGERSVLYQPANTLAPPDLHEPARDRLRDAAAVLLDAVDLHQAIEAAKIAKAAGALVVLDVDCPAPGIEELLTVTDVVITAAEFPLRLAATDNLRRALRFTAKKGPWFVGATLGPGGAIAYVQGREHFVRGFPVHAVDSTGAGDVFHAGCIFGLLSGWNVTDTLRFAAAASALKCRKVGGRPGIPTVEEALCLARRDER
ncbi:MAG: PfkB family carbohydrate kinase [Candidatus Binatia bacterium]|nr:PfkB family carbohydrate kinase [Candidatus Binatia bacterium]